MSKPNPDLIVVGAIVGAHGVRGDVRVKSFTAEPAALFDYAPFLSESGAPLLDPKSSRAAKDHFVVSPKHIRQKEEWDALKSTKLYVPRGRLPPAGDNEFYIDQLIGLSVYGGGEEMIGKVTAVFNHGAGDLLEIAPNAGGKSVLVPFTLTDVPTVDLTTNRLIVTTFEIWADESKPEDA